MALFAYLVPASLAGVVEWSRNEAATADANPNSLVIDGFSS